MTLAGTRTTGLDLMRAAAISFVLLNHFCGDLIIPHLGSARQWWITGPLGVDLFFALSGFLIGRILFGLGETISEPRVLIGFLGRRWMRTLPLYYLLLAFNLGVVLHEQGYSWELMKMVTPYAYFGSSFYTRAPRFFNEAWSLGVEECFYLFFPLIWAGLIRLRVKPGPAYIACGVLMLLVPVWLRFHLRLTMQSSWIADLHGITVYRLDAIALGVLAAAVSLRCPAIWPRWRYPGLVLGLTILFYDWYILTDEILDPRGFMTIWHFTANSVGCVLILPWCSMLRKLPSIRFERAVVAVAHWSYSLYLVHIPILVGSKALFAVQLKESALWSWFVLALVIVTSVGTAAALHSWFEKPVMALRERWQITRHDVS